MTPLDKDSFDYLAKMARGISTCTILFYKGTALVKRDRISNPVDLQIAVESVTDTNFGLWNWKPFPDLVVMRCDKYNESIIIYPNAA